MRPYRAVSQTLGRGTATPGPPLRARAAPGVRGHHRDLGAAQTIAAFGTSRPAAGEGVPMPVGPACSPRGRELPRVPSRPRSLPRSAGAMASPFWEWPWGARGHPSHTPRWLLEDARRLLEPRAPAGMGESGDFETQRLKLSNLTFDEDFCRLSIFSYLPSQNPLHLWCAFRAAMNFKMCKNDRILTKALIFLFIFMCFIN